MTLVGKITNQKVSNVEGLSQRSNLKWHHANRGDSGLYQVSYICRVSTCLEATLP